ncbi:MAG: DUF1059 domain-containing protein [Cyclobacteriaceae bacterium]
MKTMTCNQLGGACNLEFHGNTFDEIVEQSKAHGMEMFQSADPAHLKAIGEMQQLMQSPDGMSKWFESKKQEFEALPENN